MTRQLIDLSPTGRGRGPDRVRTPVVDQHATWIAVNPVQGCPKACRYCFLNERGQTAVRPEHLATPAESVDLLVASPFYDPSRPVALYTWTDVMALPASRAHLADLLEVLTDRQVPNPFVLITKCRVPDDTVAAIAAARDRGLRVVVYLSYSGLPRDIERGIRHDELRDNFPRLAAAGIPIVHYWRPAFPESATPDTMTAVLDWAHRFAQCTVAAGLKVEPAALPRLAEVWPELATAAGVTEAEGVYPQEFWEFIHGTGRHHPDYPVFHTNSCALAYVFGEPDRFGTFGAPVCVARNICPDAQRAVCGVAATRRSPLDVAGIEAALAGRGLGGIGFTVSADGAELVLDGAVATSAVAAVTQDLGVRVRVSRQGSDPYWSSGTAGAQPLVLG